MSATVLTIVNRVLRKLRESTVASIDGDDYAELITDFLTETKEDVEDAFDWQCLQSTVTVDTVAGTAQYKLTGVYERSLVKAVYDQTHDTYLEFNPAKVEEGLRYTTPDQGDPVYYDFVGFNDDGEMLVELYPVPAVTNDRFVFYGKFVQGDVAYTSPDTTYISTPTLPLVLGTYARAVDERGEDDGEAFTKAEAKYRKALSNSVAYDNGAQGDITDWYEE